MLHAQVDRAIAQALEEASLHGGTPSLDFEAFLKILRTGAPDDLTQYDDRMGASLSGSSDSLAEEAAAVFDAAAAVESQRLTDLAGEALVSHYVMCELKSVY